MVLQPAHQLSARLSKCCKLCKFCESCKAIQPDHGCCWMDQKPGLRLPHQPDQDMWRRDPCRTRVILSIIPFIPHLPVPSMISETRCKDTRRTPVARTTRNGPAVQFDAVFWECWKLIQLEAQKVLNVQCVFLLFLDLPEFSLSECVATEIS